MSILYPNGVIPHKKPLNMTHKKWHMAYKNQLIDMYLIMSQIIEEFDHKVGENLRTTESFLLFSKMIYLSSSKYISPYLPE